jgi:hypothetical protein
MCIRIYTNMYTYLYNFVSIYSYTSIGRIDSRPRKGVVFITSESIRDDGDDHDYSIDSNNRAIKSILHTKL